MKHSTVQRAFRTNGLLIALLPRKDSNEDHI